MPSGEREVLDSEVVGPREHEGAALKVGSYGGRVRHDKRGMLVGRELVDAASSTIDRAGRRAGTIRRSGCSSF